MNYRRHMEIFSKKRNLYFISFKFKLIACELFILEYMSLIFEMLQGQFRTCVFIHIVIIKK